MTPDPNRPTGADDPERDGTRPTEADPVPEAADVRRMLHDRSRSITPRGTFMDIEERVHAADADRRRNRTLISAAAAVVLVVLVAGGITLANQDSDDSQQVDTADATTLTSTSEAETTSTGAQETTSTTEEQPDPTEPTDPSDTTSTTDVDTEPPGVQPISAGTAVRIDGIGPISVPLTVAEAAVATGQDVRVDPNSRIEESSPCGFADIEGLDELWFMVDGDRIVRVDVGGSSPLRTEAGVGVGSTKAEVLAAYAGQVTEEAHPYAMDENSRYLVVTDPVYPAYEIIFSVHQGTVADYRSGLADFVRYPEGCA